MSEIELGLEAGRALAPAAAPFLFAGLSGAVAVAGALTAGLFWRRATALEAKIERLARARERDLGAEHVFLIDQDAMAPASTPAALLLADARRAYDGEPSLEETLALLLTDADLDALAPKLRRLATRGAGFSYEAADHEDGRWRVRGDVEGAQPVLRLWPLGPIDRDEAMRQAPAQLAAYGLERAPTGVLLLDAGGRLRAANAAARRLLRLRLEFCEQGPTLGGLLDRLRDQGRTPMQVDFDDWRAAVIADPPAALDAESAWSMPDGSSLRVAAERAPSGGLALFVADVTDSAELERRLRLAVSARRATFAAIEEGLAVIGADGRLHLANPAFAKLWGLGAGVVQDAGAGQLTLAQLAREAARSPEDREIWRRIMTAGPLGDAQARRSEAFVAQRADDGALAVRVAPLPEGAALIACADVSARYRAERALHEKATALEAADKLKSEFLTDIAHTLRNPLNSIIGFADMLKEGMGGDLSERQAKYVGYVLAASHELRELISDALDLGALNAGSLAMKSETVDIGAIGVGVMALLAKRAKRQGASFESDIAEAPMAVWGDGGRLRHALYSLGVGIANLAGPGDQLTVVITRDSEEDGEAALASFALRLDRAEPAEPDERGLQDSGGVALNLAKRVVELHGGRILIGEAAERVEAVLELPLAARRLAPPSDDEPAPERRYG